MESKGRWVYAEIAEVLVLSLPKGYTENGVEIFKKILILFLITIAVYSLTGRVKKAEAIGGINQDCSFTLSTSTVPNVNSSFTVTVQAGTDGNYTVVFQRGDGYTWDTKTIHVAGGTASATYNIQDINRFNEFATNGSTLFINVTSSNSQSCGNDDAVGNPPGNPVELGALLTIGSSTVAATLTIREVTPDHITFELSKSNPFLVNPTIKIYGGQSCTGPPINQQFMAVGGANRTTISYTLTTVPSADFSAQVDLNDTPVGAPRHLSTCASGTATGPIPTPVPGPPPCPNFLGFNPNQNQFTPDLQFAALFTPPTDANTPPITAYHGRLLYDNSELNLLPVNPINYGGATFWAVSLGPLPIKDNSYQVQIIASGSSCFPQDFKIVNVVSGYNPCIGGICKTAFGNISTNITQFAGTFLSIVIGIAGGIALILLVFGSIRVLTSSGNQQTLAAGRDTIIAAVAGLLFLIFSVLILRAIGIVVGISLS